MVGLDHVQDVELLTRPRHRLRPTGSGTVAATHPSVSRGVSSVGTADHAHTGSRTPMPSSAPGRFSGAEYLSRGRYGPAKANAMTADTVLTTVAPHVEPDASGIALMTATSRRTSR
jgi:hypothetical protein